MRSYARASASSFVNCLRSSTQKRFGFCRLTTNYALFRPASNLKNRGGH